MDAKFTFDDFLIVPAFTKKDDEISIESRLFQYPMNVPIISSPMDTVTGIKMMDAMRDAGAFGFHHRYCSLPHMLEAAGHIGGLAVSPSMGISVVESIMKISGNPHGILFILDVAHGHTQKNLDFCRELVNLNAQQIISGNVVTLQAVEAYMKIGVRHFRVGLGSGSVCLTRTVTGIGYPQASAIKEIHDEFGDEICIISDGGHRTTGDIVKALYLGADFVMLGQMLSHAEEAENGGIYRGMASYDALSARGKDDFVVEGITVKTQKKREPVAKIVKEIGDAIKQACYYAGATNLFELSLADSIFITENAYREGLAHYELSRD